MSYLANRSSHPLSCNGDDSSSEDDVFLNSKLDVYADYYDKPNPHSYFVDLYDRECVMADNYHKQNKESMSPLFNQRSPGSPRGENDAIIFTIKFCGKNFGEVGLFEPDISVLDWEGFRMYLFTSLNLENPETFVIYYSDDETDKIPIESEAEYKEALKIAKDKSARQEKFVLDINRNTIGFPSLRSLVTSSIRRVNSVGSSVKAIPGPVPEKKDVTTSTSFSSLLGSLESLSIKTDRSELSEESDGLEMTAIKNSQSITPLNFIIDVDRNEGVVKRIMPTKEKTWARLGIQTYKIGYFEYNNKATVNGARPLQHIGQPATIGKLITSHGVVERPLTNNSGRENEVSFYCTFYCQLDKSEKPEIIIIESPTEVKKEVKEQPNTEQDSNSAPSWFKTSMQQLKEEMSQEISSKINERFEDLVGNFNVKDVEERLRGVIKGYGSDVQERVICCCKGKECRKMPSIDEFAQSTSRASVDSEGFEGFTNINLWNTDLLKEELEKREKEILCCIDTTYDKIKRKISYNELQRPSGTSHSSEDLCIEERERVFTRIEDFRQRQSKLPSATLRTPSKTDSICKSESYRKISPISPEFTPTRLNFTESDITDYKAKTMINLSESRLQSPNESFVVLHSNAKGSVKSGGGLNSSNCNNDQSSPHDIGSSDITEHKPTNPTTKSYEYDSKFISDEDFPDGSVVPPGVVFSKTWVVMNTGTKSWDKQTSLFCSNYESNPLVPCQRSIACPELRPGEVARIKVDLETPNTRGNDFVTKWKFAQNGVIFGNMLWCNIQVRQQGESSSRKECLECIQSSEIVELVKDNLLSSNLTTGNDSTPIRVRTKGEMKALVNSKRPAKDIIEEILYSEGLVNIGKESDVVALILAEQFKDTKRRDYWQIFLDILKEQFGGQEQESPIKRDSQDKEFAIKKDSQDKESTIISNSQDKEPKIISDSRDQEPTIIRDRQEQEPPIERDCQEPVIKHCSNEKEPAIADEQDKDLAIKRDYEEQEPAIKIDHQEQEPEAKSVSSIMFDGKAENYEHIEDSDEENEDYYDGDSDESSGEEYSDDEELSDEKEEELCENDEHERELDYEEDEDDRYLENDTPCEYESAVDKEEQNILVDTPDYLELETSTDSIEFKDRLKVTEDLEGKDNICSTEILEQHNYMKDSVAMSEVGSTAKESEVEESEVSDDDSSESCKAEESSSASDTQMKLLKATLHNFVAPEESLAAELAAAAFDDTSEIVSESKEYSQASEESLKKTSALQEHFKQNVEVNLDFEVIPHSSTREISPSPEVRELPSSAGCPLTFKERHFTVSHLPPPNPTTVPDSDDDDSFGDLVFIRAEDVPSSAPETAPGTPSASEDHPSHREFPPPSESERSVSCSSLSEYKNADDENSESDSDSCSSFSGVEEEDLEREAAAGDIGTDEISDILRDVLEDNHEMTGKPFWVFKPV